MLSRQLQQIIDKCRRAQKHPGQIEIPDALPFPEGTEIRMIEGHNISGAIIHEPVGFMYWATEEEALENWRARTVSEQLEIQGG